MGLIFRGGLSELNRLAEPRHRAAVDSTFFAAAYLGLGLPAVLTGLISRLAGTVDANVYTSVLAAAIVAMALIVVLRTFGMTPAPQPAGAHPATADAPRESCLLLASADQYRDLDPLTERSFEPRATRTRSAKSGR